jgi:hypothetical protein
MTSTASVQDMSRCLLWSTDSQPLLHPSAAYAPAQVRPIAASRRARLSRMWV